MKPEYEPKTREQILGYLVEECGEVLAAAGKTLRWGDESRNPDEDHTYCAECGAMSDEHPYEHSPNSPTFTCATFNDPRETNRGWILRELRDLENAIVRVRALYTAHPEAPRTEEPRVESAASCCPLSPRPSPRDVILKTVPGNGRE